MGECEIGYSRQTDGTCKKCDTATYENCANCTDVESKGSGNNTITIDSVCTDCQTGYIMADDKKSCKSCITSCGSCKDPKGKYCDTCSSGYLRSEDKEVCGKTCYKCEGSACETFSSANMKSEVCDACWVVGIKSDNNITHFRGCPRGLGALQMLNLTLSCDNSYKSELCTDIKGTRMCAKCCTGTNCNNFNLSQLNSDAPAMSIPLMTMLAMALTTFLATY